MKTFRTLNNKKLIIITYLLTVFLLILTTCQKVSEISEINKENNEFLPEKKSSDNLEEIDELGKMENENFPVIIKPEPRTPRLSYDDTLLYKYEDIYIPFTNPSLPNAMWYRYNPLTNKWYSFNPNKIEEHEIEVSVSSIRNTL